MSLIVPASPVAVELCSTSDEQPIIVRAHARARTVRAASTGTAWGDVYARQRKRVEAEHDRFMHAVRPAIYGRR